jgi:hypothetical protein
MEMPFTAACHENISTSKIIGGKHGQPLVKKKKNKGNGRGEGVMEGEVLACAGSPKRVTFTGFKAPCHETQLLYVTMSAEIFHFRLVASWLNCRETCSSNSFMTTSLKSGGKPVMAKILRD